MTVVNLKKLLNTLPKEVRGLMPAVRSICLNDKADTLLVGTFGSEIYELKSSKYSTNSLSHLLAASSPKAPSGTSRPS